MSSVVQSEISRQGGTDIRSAVEDDEKDERHDGRAHRPDGEERDGVDDERQSKAVERAKTIGRGPEPEPANEARKVVAGDETGTLRGREADRRRVGWEEEWRDEEGENPDGGAKEEQEEAVVAKERPAKREQVRSSAGGGGREERKARLTRPPATWPAGQAARSKATPRDSRCR
jgi:hypothetical protein